MGAVIATLRDIGWDPNSPTRWTDPDEQQWDFDPGSPGLHHDLKHHLAHHITKQLWTKSSAHYHGAGLEDGADLSILKTQKQGLQTGGPPGGRAH